MTIKALEKALHAEFLAEWLPALDALLTAGAALARAGLESKAGQVAGARLALAAAALAAVERGWRGFDFTGAAEGVFARLSAGQCRLYIAASQFGHPPAAPAGGPDPTGALGRLRAEIRWQNLAGAALGLAAEPSVPLSSTGRP
jgi:hypothetical protein